MSYSTFEGFIADRIPYIEPEKGQVPYVIVPTALAWGFKNITPAAKMTYIALMGFDFAGVSYNDLGKKLVSRKGAVYVSLGTLSELLESTPNTLRNHLIQLETAGLLWRNTDSANNTEKLFDFRPILEEQRKIDTELEKLNIGIRLDSETRNSYSASEDKVEGIPKNEVWPLVGERDTKNKELQNKNSVSTYIEGGESPSTNVISRGPVNVPDSCPELESVPDNYGTKHIDIVEDTPENRKRIKNADKLLSGECVGPKAIIDYFTLKYQAHYKQPYFLLKDRTPTGLSVLQKAFMAKYPRDQWTTIIDNLFEFYDKIPNIPKDKYPRPRVSSLSQPWLIELITVAAENCKRHKDLRDAREKPKTLTELNMADSFYMRLLEAGIDELFFQKLESGKLQDVNWINDSEYPIDKIVEAIKNA